MKELAPTCKKCGGYSRPDIVFFGESLSTDVLLAAYQQVLGCYAMIVVGTSGLVYPAANIPMVAYRIGAIIIEVNPTESLLSPITTICLRGTTSEIMPALQKELLKKKPL